MSRGTARFPVCCAALALLSAPCAGQSLISAAPPGIVLPEDAFGQPFFPDGSMFSALVGGQKLYFAANGGRVDLPSQGTIVLSGPLDRLQPLLGSPDQVIASLHAPPDRPESPFAQSFDRDYAGGGPVAWDAPSGLLLHAYHAEYDFVQGRPFNFYSSIGMAVSSDGGRSFRRLGLAVRPAIPPDSGQRMPTSAGTLVRVGAMLYLYYDDMSADRTCDGQAQGGLPCLAVAATPYAAAIEAAAHGSAPVWRKYYHGAFTEPGDGGAFSPLVVADAAHWIRWPAVMRDPATGWFFLVYAAGAQGLELRTSRDGLAWGKAIAVMAAPEDTAINYPSILDIAPSQTQPGFDLTIAFVALSKEGGRIDFRRRRLETVAIKVAAP
jgi:hypothetical protein